MGIILTWHRRGLPRPLLGWALSQQKWAAKTQSRAKSRPAQALTAQAHTSTRPSAERISPKGFQGSSKPLLKKRWTEALLEGFMGGFHRGQWRPTLHEPILVHFATKTAQARGLGATSLTGSRSWLATFLTFKNSWAGRPMIYGVYCIWLLQQNASFTLKNSSFIKNNSLRYLIHDDIWYTYVNKVTTFFLYSNNQLDYQWKCASTRACTQR